MSNICSYSASSSSRVGLTGESCPAPVQGWWSSVSGERTNRRTTALERRHPSSGTRHRALPNLARMDLEFSGEIWFWRGPSPFHFVTVPEEQSFDLEAIS